MYDRVTVGGKQLSLSSLEPIGRGGEAEIYPYTANTVLRILLSPDDFAFDGDKEAQKAARMRLDELPGRLAQFPSNLPSNVIAPGEPVFDTTSGRMIGHTMPFVENAVPLVEYADLDFCDLEGISRETIGELLLHMYDTVVALHEANIIIGDFNCMNVLVNQSTHKPYFIDTLSYQYGSYKALTFQALYVDPLLCKESGDSAFPMERIYWHSRQSDWYSFWVLAFQLLTGTLPHGGIHRPEKASDEVPDPQRALKRIHVMRDDVDFPEVGIHYHCLPDPLVVHFEALFEHDRREIAPRAILEKLSWKKCEKCSGVFDFLYAREQCPGCHAVVVNRIQKEAIEASGLSRESLLRGYVLDLIANADGTCDYAYYKHGALYRKGETPLVKIPSVRDACLALHGDTTLVGTRKATYALIPGKKPVAIPAERFRGGLPVIGANQKAFYYSNKGSLWKATATSPEDAEAITDVLPGHTLIWVGPSFGLGFFRASGIERAFLFDTETASELVIDLPSLPGRILDMYCSFAGSTVWMFLARDYRGTVRHHCFCISADARIIGSADAIQHDGSWLGYLRGKCAARQQHAGEEVPFLLSTTNASVIQLQAIQNRIVERIELKGTELFVKRTDSITYSPQGLYVANRRELILLTQSSN